jgi:hypothetical protein
VNAEQFNGPLRGLGPLVVGMLVYWGMDDVTAGLTSTAILAVAAAAWSFYKNRSAGIAQQAALIPGVEVVVSRDAPEPVRKLASDPTVMNIVPR